MSCQPSRSLNVLVAPPALSLADQQRAEKPRFAFLRRLLLMPRLPRLDPAELSEHRLRDLGFMDGR